MCWKFAQQVDRGASQSMASASEMQESRLGSLNQFSEKFRILVSQNNNREWVLDNTAW